MTSLTTVSHDLHLGSLGTVRVHVGRLDDDCEVLAVCHGAWNSEPRTEPVHVRIQSSCVYGEVFMSRDCDCREQLDTAVEMIRSKGAGVVVYLNQEGRGAGLFAKASGYQHVQRTNVDTFTAYEELGLPADARDYGPAVSLLRDLGIDNVRLLTNNPAKLSALVEAGFKVEREALVIEPNEENRAYLAAKRQRGHLPGDVGDATDLDVHDPDTSAQDDGREQAECSLPSEAAVFLMPEVTEGSEATAAALSEVPPRRRFWARFRVNDARAVKERELVSR